MVLIRSKATGSLRGAKTYSKYGTTHKSEGNSLKIPRASELSSFFWVRRVFQ